MIWSSLLLLIFGQIWNQKLSSFVAVAAYCILILIGLMSWPNADGGSEIRITHSHCNCMKNRFVFIEFLKIPLRKVFLFLAGHQMMKLVINDGCKKYNSQMKCVQDVLFWLPNIFWQNRMIFFGCYLVIDNVES